LTNPYRKRPLRRWMGLAWLKIFGWHVEGSRPSTEKAVVIAYPHTTNWDLPFTLATAFALDVEIHWLGKKGIFKPPFGWFFRMLGGIPVERSRSTNLVDGIVATLEPIDHVLVIIPPEGTRSQSGRWKTGFYWVAVGARLPIILGYLDYTRKCGGLGEVFEPSGDIDADLDKIRSFYQGIKGKYPELQGAITFEPDSD
jgi:1-acyl-sn-glycerol-3-phosphate acyltransferase